MDGVLNINKPIGISSFDVVRYIRRVGNIKKVGHAGTLDPAATGVLPVCLGRATKIIDYIMNDIKSYSVELRLGITTDTYDREGSIISEKAINVNEKDIIDAILSFIGESYQIPPMYSALKVNGQRLYDLARKGVEVEREARKINIFDIKINSVEVPYVKFDVKCSKGTYIRSLCFDIGEKLGCGGMMSGLERTSSSIFNINEAIDLYDINAENISNLIMPIEKALEIFPRFDVEDNFAMLLCNGVQVKDRRLTNKIEENVIFRVYNKEKELLGLGIKKEDTFKIVNLLI